jgi:hydroxymethylbilane synthase
MWLPDDASWGSRPVVIKQPIRIGTRASKLALTQAGAMRDAIAALIGDDEAAVLVHITTSGDRIQDRRLMDIGGKGLFTKEIEEPMLDGRIDCAVHSLKDMPVDGPRGLSIAAIPRREDPRDAFLSSHFDSLEALPQGARLGTASLRRQAQALHRRPDLDVFALRGNVDSRLEKLNRGEADAILLAASGLNRLGLGHLPKGMLDPRESPPAPGQGALAIQTRDEDVDARWLAPLRDREASLTVAAERGALAALEGSCRTAVGAHAVIEMGRLSLIVEALTPDGTRRFREFGTAGVEDEAAETAARALGLRLGAAVREAGGDALLVPL